MIDYSGWWFAMVDYGLPWLTMLLKVFHIGNVSLWITMVEEGRTWFMVINYG